MPGHTNDSLKVTWTPRALIPGVNRCGVTLARSSPDEVSVSFGCRLFTNKMNRGWGGTSPVPVRSIERRIVPGRAPWSGVRLVHSSYLPQVRPRSDGSLPSPAGCVVDVRPREEEQSPPVMFGEDRRWVGGSCAYSQVMDWTDVEGSWVTKRDGRRNWVRVCSKA